MKYLPPCILPLDFKTQNTVVKKVLPINAFIFTHNEQMTVRSSLTGFTLTAQEAESNFGSCTDAFQIRYDNVKTTQTASFCLLFIFWQHKRLHSLHVT